MKTTVQLNDIRWQHIQSENCCYKCKHFYECGMHYDDCQNFDLDDQTLDVHDTEE